MLMYPFGFATGDVNGPFLTFDTLSEDCDNGCSMVTKVPFGFPYFNYFSTNLYVSKLSVSDSPHCQQFAAVQDPHAGLSVVKQSHYIKFSVRNLLYGIAIKMRVILI
jgi:hypothetical protein